jgi:hypothetical protein
MVDLLDVIKVKAEPNYRLILEFENGEKRIFDMSRFMDEKPYNRIKNSPIFMKASVAYGTVVWPGNIDIAPETLYTLSAPV